MPQIRSMVSQVSGKPDTLRELWKLARSGRGTTSVNAIWVMTHLPKADFDWLISIRDEMIDMLLTESNTAKKRLMLTILREQEYSPVNIRADFLDYCMTKINSEQEPYAIRCFSLYAAFKMCLHYPELLTELEAHLDMMQSQVLSPGLRSALRRTQSNISKTLRRKHVSND